MDRRRDSSDPWFGPFSKGDRVKLIAGPFEGFDGVVQEINPYKQTIRVVVTIFRRPTPIEVGPSQLELL